MRLFQMKVSNKNIQLFFQIPSQPWMIWVLSYFLCFSYIYVIVQGFTYFMGYQGGYRWDLGDDTQQKKG